MQRWSAVKPSLDVDSGPFGGRPRAPFAGRRASSSGGTTILRSAFVRQSLTRERGVQMSNRETRNALASQRTLTRPRYMRSCRILAPCVSRRRPRLPCRPRHVPSMRWTDALARGRAWPTRHRPALGRIWSGSRTSDSRAPARSRSARATVRALSTFGFSKLGVGPPPNAGPP